MMASVGRTVVTIVGEPLLLLEGTKPGLEVGIVLTEGQLLMDINGPAVGTVEGFLVVGKDVGLFEDFEQVGLTDVGNVVGTAVVVVGICGWQGSLRKTFLNVVKFTYSKHNNSF